MRIKVLHRRTLLKNQIVSEINDTKELPEGHFTINYKLIEKYQRKHPSLINNYKYATYQKYVSVEEVI